jgi:hypothetical protein
MRPHGTKALRFKRVFRELLVAAAGLIFADPAFAQVSGSSPWENAVNVLQLAFTSTTVVSGTHRRYSRMRETRRSPLLSGRGGCQCCV